MSLGREWKGVSTGGDLIDEGTSGRGRLVLDVLGFFEEHFESFLLLFDFFESELALPTDSGNSGDMSISVYMLSEVESSSGFGGS